MLAIEAVDAAEAVAAIVEEAVAEAPSREIVTDVVVVEGENAEPTTHHVATMVVDMALGAVVETSCA